MRKKEIDVLAAEDLGDEFAAGLQHAEGEIECSPEELALHVDVEVVETCDVWRAVGNDEING